MKGQTRATFKMAHFPELYQSVFIFTDGSEDPDTGCAGATVYIPESKSYMKKRV